MDDPVHIHPDMTFAVDWALRTNDLSIYLSIRCRSLPLETETITYSYVDVQARGCSTTSKPVYCQGDRESASLLQLSQAALMSQIGVATTVVQPTVWDSKF